MSIICSLVSESDDALYRELWHACAGPLVTVPRVGERVFYFPQGHIEQVGLCHSSRSSNSYLNFFASGAKIVD